MGKSDICSLLVSMDEYCYRHKDKYFLSKNGLLFASRYLTVFDEIKIFIRTKPTEDASLLENKKEVTDKRIQILPVPFFQGPAQYSKVYFKVVRAAKCAAKECDFAIFRLPSTVGLAAWKQWVKTKKEYATEIVFNCKDAYETSDSLINKILWKRIHLQQMKACRNASGVACVTRHNLQQYYYPSSKDSITCHYSSIELTPEFFFHKRSYPEKEKFTIIHIANQVEYRGRKGHNELIKAISIVSESRDDLQIVFVGEDYNNGINQLKKYASDLNLGRKIVFTGYLAKDQLRNELINADIAVLPTKAEGLPRVVIEAMSMGLPCVTTPISGNPELIDSEYLVDYNDVEKLASLISKLASDKTEYERQSEINFKKSLEYSNEVLNPRRTKFFKALRNKIEKI